MQWESLTECLLCHSAKIATLCEQNHFSQCLDCGLVFDNPRPSWNSILEFYSKEEQYDDWLKEERARDDLWRRRLKLILRLQSGGRLLDVGAGIGQFLHVAKSHFEVEGSEISPTAIAIAKDKYGLSLRSGTVESLRWEKPFDVLTLFHVLEHVPDPSQTLKICHSLLSFQGLLVIAVPNDVEAILTRRNRIMKQWKRPKYQILGNLGLPALTLSGSEIHLSHFTSSVLATALRSQGFEIVENGLDPSFAATGCRKFRRLRRYHTYRAIQAVSGLNLYDTIWIAARKRQ